MRMALSLPFLELFVSPPSRVDSVPSYNWQPWLKKQLAARVTLVWTDNRASIISVRGSSSVGYQLRLHHMFCQAPDAVWHALVAYIADKEAAALDVLQAYIQRQQHLIRRAPQRQPRAQPLQPTGRHFDLEDIYRQLNQTYFANRVQAHITWTRQPPRRQRTSIRFGSYDDRHRLIRIHRLLDQPFVPLYFVESVVFHEMLHQLIPRQRINGRWYIHPLAFRQQEQRFPHYWHARKWQRQHLAHLLRG